MSIRVIGSGNDWLLVADSSGIPAGELARLDFRRANGLFWSVDRSWCNDIASMKFPTKELAETYLALNREKMEHAPVQR